MSLTTQNYWIKGDRVLWCIISLLVIFSFLPVFSASSNLAYVIGKGTPLGYLIKHFVIMSFGFSLLYAVHKVPYTYFKGISVLTDTDFHFTNIYRFDKVILLVGQMQIGGSRFQ